MAFEIESWYNEISVGDVIVQHKGAISPELICIILEKIENELEKRDEKSKLKKKVYNVMVEALQNLYHHSERPPEIFKNEENEKKFVIFVLKKVSEGNYSFISANFIEENRVKFLKDRIDQINYLNTEDMKILYQLILNNSEYSDKGGGGLGLVDIAKRTGHHLEYSFNKYSEGHYFFSLKISITN
jgi:hypothetical protein